MDVVLAIKNEATKQKISLAEIGRRLEMSQQNFNQMLKPDSIKFSVVQKIAAALGVSIGYLLGETLNVDAAKEVMPQPSASSNDLAIQLVKENGDLHRQLGAQTNENKHLHEKNMKLITEINELKSEIEQLKNTRRRVVEYPIHKPELMAVAEARAEYDTAKK